MDLKDIAFDQYQRYEITRKLIEEYKLLSNKSKLNILDVGGYFKNKNGEDWLPIVDFFPNDYTISLDVVDCSLDHYVKGSGDVLPFPDNSFDIVITNDTLEHITSENRKSFIKELMRVSTNHIILTAPFYSSVNATFEKALYEFIVFQLKADHHMLKEHLENIPPKLEELEEILHSFGLHYSYFSSGNSYNWFLMMIIKHYLLKFNNTQNLEKIIDRYYNENLFEGDQNQEPSYRKVFIISKEDDGFHDCLKNKGIISKPIKSNFDLNNGILSLTQTLLKIIELESANDKDHTNYIIKIDSHSAPTPKLGKELSIKQKIFVTEDNFNKISLLAATYGKTYSNGSIGLKLLGQHGEMVLEKEISLSELQDNQWLNVSFPPIASSKDKEYTIQLSSSNISNQDVSFWLDETVNYFGKNSLYFNESEANGTLCIKVYCRDFNSSEKYYDLYLKFSSELKNSIDENGQLQDKIIEFKNENILLESLNKELKEKLDTILADNKHLEVKNKELLSTFKKLEISLHNLFQEQFHKKIEEQEIAIHNKEVHIQNLENYIKAIETTRGWRLLEKFRRAKNFIKKNKSNSISKVANKVKERGIKGTIQLLNEKIEYHDHIGEYYDQWFKNKIPSEEKLDQLRTEIIQFEKKPIISIIVPTYNTDENLLRKAIKSVINQVYPYWELCICDDKSPNENVFTILQEYAEKDDRIKVTKVGENLGIAGCTNKAIELATGDYIGFLDHDDELTIDALYEVVKSINEDNPDLIYSDEDKLEMDGTFSDPFFKPDWSPDYLLSTNYICHFALYRKAIGDDIGWINLGYDGAQDYDFVLRFTEKTDKIHHIPKVLYHWRKIPGSTAESFGAKSYAQDAGMKAVEAALNRRGIDGEVRTTKIPGRYRVKRFIDKEPKVSIIIPTKDKVELLRVCISSILNKTNYSNYEIIVINNNSVEQETYQYFDKMKPKIKVLDFTEPFNYSKMNNFAVSQSDGDFLLFLNNDTEVIKPDWLESMVEHGLRKEVGVVGAKLLYTNDTIQHGGVILGVGGVANHAFLNLPKNADGYMGMLNDIRNCSAVTAACMLVRREVFEEVKGFNERDLAIAFNDVDLCLKIITKGYLCVWTPEAELYHHESATRSREVDGNEVKYMRDNWVKILDNDPFYNLNFDRNEVINSYSKLC